MGGRRQHSDAPAEHSQAIEDVSENTPLLAVSDAAPAADSRVSAPGTLHGSDVDDPDHKPLPKLQIFLLCFSRWLEPVAFFSIFPYINKMCQENGHLAKEDVGFYSGLIESLFSLTQMIVMIFWGKAADRFGRKPVLVTSLVGVSLATSIFGLATTIWEMILFRCMAGMFAGTVLMVRTMITENSTPKTSATAFSYFAFAGNLGIMTGPLLGGAFAEPAKQFPRLFKDISLFVDHPYALPSFIIGTIGLIVTLSCAFFLEETLPAKTRASDGNQGEEGAVVAKPVRMSTWQLVKSPGVGLVLYTYQHIMLLAFGYTAIVPVFWYTTVELGGLEFSTQQISLFMGFNGLCQALWILVAFPLLQRRVGTNAVIRACAIAYPFFFITMPVLNLLLRIDTPASTTVFWIAAPVLLGAGCGVSMCFTAIQLALNEVSPSFQMIGILNALCLALTSGLRSFSPVLFSSLFAIGVKTQWLWGYGIWLLLALLGAGFLAVATHLPDYDELRRQREKADLVARSNESRED